MLLNERTLTPTSGALDTPHSDWGEIFSDSLESIKRSYEIGSRAYTKELAYDARLDAIEKATGEKRVNPMRVYTEPVPGAEQISPQRDFLEEHAFKGWLGELAEKYPDQRDVIGPDRSIDEEAFKLGREAEEKEHATWERAGPGLGKYVPYTGAMLTAAATDPLNVAALAIGPWGLVGTGAKQVIWNGLKTGAVNAGVEAVAQPFIQKWRSDAGLDYGVSHAALNVAAAGLFGFGLDAGIRGGYRGAQRGLGRQPVLDAEGKVTGYSRRQTPAIEPPARTLDPAAALEEAAAAQPADSLLRRAQDGDDAALLQAARESGTLSDPAVRGAADELERYMLFGRPPDIDAGEHDLRLANAIRASMDPEAPPPGNAVRGDDPAPRGYAEEDYVAAWRSMGDDSSGLSPEERASMRHALDDLGLHAGLDEPEVRSRVRQLIAESSSAEGLPGASAKTGAGSLRDARALPDTAKPGDKLSLEGKPIEVRHLDPSRSALDPDSLTRAPEGRGVAVAFEASDGTMLVQRTVRQREAEAAPVAYVFRESDGWAADDARVFAAVQNLKEMSGSPLDMAVILRARPELANRSLPLTDYKFKQAVALSRLSDAAFAAVQRGDLPANRAAIVGDLVTDTSRHLDLISELAKANLKSAEQTRLYLGQLLAQPAAADTHAVRFGADAAFRDLLPERTQILDAGIKTLKIDKRIFGLLDREAQRIESAGNILERDANAARADLSERLAGLVETLANVHGPVNDALQASAMAVARGVRFKTAVDAFVRKIGDLYERDSLDGLLRTRAASSDLAPQRIDDPFGAEARAQVEALEAARPTDRGRRFALPDDDELESWLQAQGKTDDARSSASQTGRGGSQAAGREAAASQSGTPATDRARQDRQPLLRAGGGEGVAGRGSGAGSGGGVGRGPPRFDFLPGYDGRVIATTGRYGVETRHYYLYKDGAYIPSKEGKVALNVMTQTHNWVARMKLIERGPDRWEIESVKVRQGHRGKGLASSFYDAVERNLGSKIEPSGVLTDDGHRFWLKRNADAVRFHRQVDGRWYSPKQLINLKVWLNGMAEQATSVEDIARLAKYNAKVNAALANLPAEAVVPERMRRMFALPDAFEDASEDYWSDMASMAGEDGHFEWIERNMARGRQRAPEKAYVEREAEILEDAVASFEKELVSAGVPSTEIAQAIETHFGFAVDPDPATWWWRKASLKTAAKPQARTEAPTKRSVGFDLTSEQRDTAVRLAKEGWGAGDIIEQVAAASDKYISPGAIAQIVEPYFVKQIRRLGTNFTEYNAERQATVTALQAKLLAPEVMALPEKEAASLLGVSHDQVQRARRKLRQSGALPAPSADQANRGPAPNIDTLLLLDAVARLSTRTAADVLGTSIGNVQRSRNRLMQDGRLQTRPSGAPTSQTEIETARTAIATAQPLFALGAKTQTFEPGVPRPLRVRAFHGTGSPLEGGTFDVARSQDRLGPHFGTQSQAAHFARTATDDPTDAGTVYPVELNFANAIEIPDQFIWRPGDVASAIEDAYPQFRGMRAKVDAAIKGMPEGKARDNAHRDAVRQYLLDNGVDGIKYHNNTQAEGVGTSYIAIGPGTVKNVASGEMLFALPDGQVEASRPLPSSPIGAGSAPVGPFDFSKPSVQTVAENGTELLYRADHKGVVHISRFETAPDARGQGNGAALLEKLTQEADRTGRTVKLTADPGPKGDQARLMKFYERFGFKAGGEEGEMSRLPSHSVEAGRATPPPLPEGMGEAPTLSSMRRSSYGLTPFAARELPDIKAEIDAVIERLPPGIRARVEDRIVIGGRSVDGMWDPHEMLIRIALNERAGKTALEEEWHVLEELGFLTPNETAVVWAKAERQGLRAKYKIDERYTPAYERAFANDPQGLEAALRSETMARMRRERSTGADFGGTVNRVLDRINEFFERLRNLLAGRGYQSANDVFDLIDKGEVGTRRPPISHWLEAREEYGRAVANGRYALSGDPFLAKEAKQLTDDITAFEDALWKEGRAADEIAAAVYDRYGLHVSAENIATRQVWWRVGEVADRASNPGVMEFHDTVADAVALSPDNVHSARTSTDVSARPATAQSLGDEVLPDEFPAVGAPLDAEQAAQAVALWQTGTSPAAIAHALADQSGKYVRTRSVLSTLEERGLISEFTMQKRAPVASMREASLGEIAKALEERQAMGLPRDPAARARALSHMMGAYVRPGFLAKAEARAAERAVRSQVYGAIDVALRAPENARKTAAEIADTLARQRGKRVSAQDVLRRRRELRSAGEDIAGPDNVWRSAQHDILRAGAERKDSAATIAKQIKRDTGVDVTEKAVYRQIAALRGSGEDVALVAGSQPGRRMPWLNSGKFEWTDEAIAALTSEEVKGLTADAAAALLGQRFGAELTPNAIRLKRSKLKRSMPETMDDAARSEALGNLTKGCRR